MQQITGQIPSDGWYWCKYNAGDVNEVTGPKWFNDGEMPAFDEVIGPILNPFEDTEAIDGGWLERIGFQRIEHGPMGTMWRSGVYVDLDPKVVVRIRDWCLPQIKTRHELLKLLDALGVEVDA